MNSKLLSKLFLSTAIVFMANPALSADGHDHSTHAHSDKPYYGHLDIKIHADSILDAEEADEEINESYTHSHLELGARLGKGLSINTHIKLEGESSGHSHGHSEEESGSHGDNRFFESHPLIIEQLTLNYDDEQFAAYLGKFNPIVGFDYHNFPGIYGYQTIEGYAIRERVGFGGAVKHNAGDYGKHRLDVSTFFADTTALSGSLFHQREHNSKEDGGLSNTEDLSSYAVSLGGSDFYSLNNNIVEGLSYRVGYAEQAAGVDNENDEKRYSLSLAYKQKITKDMTAKILAEHLDIEHFGGEAAHDRAYSTAALKLDYKQWNLGTSYTHINNDAEEDDEGHNGKIYQLSAGYTFNNGIGVGLGYQRSDEENEVTDRMGALVSYSYEF